MRRKGNEGMTRLEAAPWSTRTTSSAGVIATLKHAHALEHSVYAWGLKFPERSGKSKRWSGDAPRSSTIAGSCFGTATYAATMHARWPWLTPTAVMRARPAVLGTLLAWTLAGGGADVATSRIAANHKQHHLYAASSCEQRQAAPEIIKTLFEALQTALHMQGLPTW